MENSSWLLFVDLLVVELHDRPFPCQGNSPHFFSAAAARPMDYAWRTENLFCFQEREPI
jgi:hypothetical protein